ncbi:hypothetical protein ABVT39_021972 [Epinephelus coioides]
MSDVNVSEGHDGKAHAAYVPKLTGNRSEEQSAPVTDGIYIRVQGLTFEQQKELLLLQMEHDKIKFEMEAKKQLELEVIRQQTEKVKLELGYRQSLDNAKKLIEYKRLHCVQQV